MQTAFLQGEGRSAQLLGYLVRAVQIEIPWFIEFEETYKDGGVAALGVLMDEDGWMTSRRNSTVASIRSPQHS
jgi:hypothetical protein